MPKVSESTQASTRPPGRSTRAISATRSSAPSLCDRVRSSAITASAQRSARNASPAPSAATVEIVRTVRTVLASVGDGAGGSMTRSTR